MFETLQKIQSELKAPKGQKNTFGNYYYRSCEDILEALKPILEKHKAAVVISDEIVCIGGECSVSYVDGTDDKNKTIRLVESSTGRIYVKATATIHCGEKSVTATAFAREGDNKKGMDDAQLTGATSSYARKYALNGLLCIDDTKDADATNEHGKGEQKQEPSQQQNTTTGKPFYNDFHKQKGTMLAKLDSGEYANPEAIISKLSEKFKISGKDRDLIKGLAQG